MQAQRFGAASCCPSNTVVAAACTAWLTQVQALVPLQEQQPAGGAAAVATAGDVPPSPAQAAAVHLLRALDVDGDGAASRRDMLRAFRRDRQLAGAACAGSLGWHRMWPCTQQQGASALHACMPGWLAGWLRHWLVWYNTQPGHTHCLLSGSHALRADHLKMPARIRAGDGTFDAFLSRFITINRSGLGLVNSQELAAYLAALPAGAAAGSSGGCSRVATAASSAR